MFGRLLNTAQNKINSLSESAAESIIRLVSAWGVYSLDDLKKRLQLLPKTKTYRLDLAKKSKLLIKNESALIDVLDEIPKQQRLDLAESIKHFKYSYPLPEIFNLLPEKDHIDFLMLIDRPIPSDIREYTESIPESIRHHFVKKYISEIRAPFIMEPVFKLIPEKFKLDLLKQFSIVMLPTMKLRNQSSLLTPNTSEWLKYMLSTLDSAEARNRAELVLLLMNDECIFETYELSLSIIEIISIFNDYILDGNEKSQSNNFNTIVISMRNECDTKLSKTETEMSLITHGLYIKSLLDIISDYIDCIAPYDPTPSIAELEPSIFETLNPEQNSESITAIEQKPEATTIAECKIEDTVCAEQKNVEQIRTNTLSNVEWVDFAMKSIVKSKLLSTPLRRAYAPENHPIDIILSYSMFRSTSSNNQISESVEVKRDADRNVFVPKKS